MLTFVSKLRSSPCAEKRSDAMPLFVNVLRGDGSPSSSSSIRLPKSWLAFCESARPSSRMGDIAEPFSLFASCSLPLLLSSSLSASAVFPLLRVQEELSTGCVECASGVDDMTIVEETTCGSVGWGADDGVVIVCFLFVSRVTSLFLPRRTGVVVVGVMALEDVSKPKPDRP